MLAWRGPLRNVQWPNKGPVDVPVELWASSQRSAFLSTEYLLFETFACIDLMPLPMLQGPLMMVYSQDGNTSQFFGELVASKLALVARLVSHSDKKASFTQIIFYGVNEKNIMKIHARPLQLHLKSQVETTDSVSAFSTKSLGAPSTAISPMDSPADSPASSTTVATVPTGINGPAKALQQIILGALRLRGVNKQHPEYKQLYHLCYRTVEFALRKHPAPITLEDMKEKVESILNILEP